MAVIGDHPMAQVVHVGQGCDMRIDTTSAHFLTGSQGEAEVRMWVRPRPEDENDLDTAVLFAIMAGDISAPVTMNRGLFGWGADRAVDDVPAPTADAGMASRAGELGCSGQHVVRRGSCCSRFDGAQFVVQSRSIGDDAPLGSIAAVVAGCSP